MNKSAGIEQFDGDRLMELAALVGQVRKARPLVHSITNYVTVNDCANALLAVGAAPVMADDLGEVAEIAALSSAVVLNIGTLNERTIAAMFKAGRTAAEFGKPVILDPVGAGASALRTATALRLAREIPLAVIRGNVSEIAAMAGEAGATRGVDAAASDCTGAGSEALARVALLVGALAGSSGAVVVATGATDVASDGAQVCLVRNGHALLPCITGSGCMLSAIGGAFCAVAGGKMLDGILAALGVMGMAGELAGQAVGKAGGLAAFRNALIDALTVFSGEVFVKRARMERWHG